MASAFELRPGVIVDPERGEVYLMNPRGGIDAIELSSGRLLWSATGAAKPLALFDQRLVAQAETSGDGRALPIVLLDTGKGGEVVFKTSVPLSADVTPSVDEGLGASLVVGARIEQGVLLVWWNFSQRTVSGIAHLGPPAERKETGAARVDLKSRQVEPLTPEEAIRRKDGATSPRKPLSAGVPAALQSRTQRVGDFLIATEAPDSSRRTILKRWSAESGEPLPDVELEPEFGVVNPSADGTLLLTRKAIGADASGWENYLWSIYSLASGRRTAQVRMPVAAAPFFVGHSILVYESRPYGRRVGGQWLEEPLELRAVSIKTGSELWKRQLRDTTYHGSSPPMP